MQGFQVTAWDNSKLKEWRNEYKAYVRACRVYCDTKFNKKSALLNGATALYSFLVYHDNFFLRRVEKQKQPRLLLKCKVDQLQEKMVIIQTHAACVPPAAIEKLIHLLIN